jgi:beta-glucanase (GH16 family)
VPKAGGGTWACTFADDFDGTAVDRLKWQVMTSRGSGFHSGSECFVDDPSTVSVARGVLSLSVRKRAASRRCHVRESLYVRESLGGWLSGHDAGMLTSFERFTQTYGRFEFRARFPSIRVRGFHSALWLYPEEKYYGRWPRSGEIDVAEFYTRTPDRVIPVVHYAGSRMDPAHTNEQCFVEHPEKFHTYTLEWSASTIRIWYDGVPCLVDSWQPWGMAQPAPFGRPFHVNLTQALGIGTNSPYFSGATHTPDEATMQVDYVRVWQ